jgi:hypothetical protein
VRHYVWSFFHYFHYSFPILHKPSFDIQTVSLPLLLTLILFGSMSSNPLDASITIQQFSHVAEGYIFDQVVSRQMLQVPQAACIDNEELELFQAGLLFLAFLNNSNDLTTRRRIRLQRIPSLSTAVRASGLFAYKRQYFSPGPGTHDWQGFIFDELRLRYCKLLHATGSLFVFANRSSRLAMWTCILDSTLCVFFNSPSQVATTELLADIPCDEDLFRAETVADFNRVASLERLAPASTLPELMSRLLFAPISRLADQEEEQTTPLNMLILVCGSFSYAS